MTAVRIQAAAVCSIGNYAFCQWTQSGTEAEITDAAGEHAEANPGHEVTCQVRETRTWIARHPDHNPEGN